MPSFEAFLSFTEQDLQVAEEEFNKAEEALNAINTEAEDYNEEEAERVKSDWDQKRAKYHQILRFFGKEVE